MEVKIYSGGCCAAWGTLFSLKGMGGKGHIRKNARGAGGKKDTAWVFAGGKIMPSCGGSSAETKKKKDKK